MLYPKELGSRVAFTDQYTQHNYAGSQQLLHAVLKFTVTPKH